MYYPIYLKSNYSFLESTIRISDLIDFAKSKNLKYLVLTDNNLIGAMDFYNSCINNNIKPLIGLEVNFDNNIFLLISKTYEEYLELIKISTKISDNTFKLEDLDNLNLTVIIPYSSSKIIKDINKLNIDLYIGVKDKNEEVNVSNKFKKIFLPKIRSLSKKDSYLLNYLEMIKEGLLEKDFNIIDVDYFIEFDEASKLVSKNTLDNTIKLVESSNLNLEKEKDLLPIYKEGLDVNKYLKNLSYKGILKRLNTDLDHLDNKYKLRLDKELKTIIDMDYANYFLIVYDFIKYAKKNDILVGPGRGTAGASLVSYSLGITEIDPLEYNLYFERFLNKERVSMPDIDTDFPDDKREEVINYVKDKYGEKQVVGIVTISRMQAKMLIRDLGRVLDIDKRLIDRLARTVKNNETLKELENNKSFMALIKSEKELEKLYNLAKRFENFPRQRSIHAAGIVMSSKKLDEVIPLIKEDNLYLSSYTMEYLEDLGLLKMDFLALKNLRFIKEILDLINKKEKLNIRDIPLDDKKTYLLFKNARTNAIFQFESEGMKRFLKELKADSFKELVAANALFRPGPSDNIPLYIKRKENKEEITYLDDSLKDILKETYGIIVYQEQLMKIANTFSTFSLGEADLLRRAISKKNKKALEKYEDKFIKGAIKKGHSKEKAYKIYQDILKFGDYGFNKSHSVSYSRLAYKMAYLKAHYSNIFYKVILDNEKNDKKKVSKYIKEAKLLGLNFKLPDINKSLRNFYIEDNTLYYPLISIRNISTKVVDDLEKVIDLDDDLYKLFTKFYEINLSEQVIDALIFSGSLDKFNFNRMTLFENRDDLIRYGELASKTINKELRVKPELEEYEEYDKEYLLDKEKDLIGFYLNESPTEIYKEEYRLNLFISDLVKYTGKNIKIILKIINVKEIITKNGDKMAFYEGMDEDYIDMVAFPSTYKKLEIKSGDIVIINGRVELREGKRQIIINDAKKIA